MHIGMMHHALTFSDFKYSNLLQIHLVAGENVPISGGVSYCTIKGICVLIGVCVCD